MVRRVRHPPARRPGGIEGLDSSFADGKAGVLARGPRRPDIVFAVPLAEKALIERIRQSARRTSRLRTGIGDDCAVLRTPAGRDLLVTTDFSLEGVHFRREWHPPEVVGHRCLTRGLSDIAAMGGVPLAVFLSLALPDKLPQRLVDSFLKGLLKLADEFRIPLAGGDTAESKAGILADIVVLGSVPRGKAVVRSGASAGDRIYVTGELGGAAAALHELFAGQKARVSDFPRHFHPVPRIAIGEFLRTKGLASAMIDLSDGLSTDLAHICEESGVGAEILVPALPRAAIGKTGLQVKLSHALDGGDDYELLFTAAPHKRMPRRIHGVPISPIGRVIRGKRIYTIDAKGVRSELKPQGWQHFRS
jgi:thiamine-monophosphate kinase